ncbi:hypothetical protein H4582DRAFT_291977 [Lactarius indigo]|nr:hypothetical protein H4582DRAFT_291977 [Lactarius indigo]
MRKPELCFFKFVLNEIKAEPSSVVFVDDKSENVLAARSLGMNGIVFDDVQRVRQSLQTFTGDPARRGLSFLEARAGRLESETNGGQIVAENFAQLLILEATNKRCGQRFRAGFSSDPTTSQGVRELRQSPSYMELFQR